MDISCLECSSENLEGSRNVKTNSIEITCLDCGTKFERGSIGSMCPTCREELIDVEHVFASSGKKWIKYCAKCSRIRG